MTIQRFPIARLFLSFILLAASAFAQKPAEELMDFTFPVPANFAASASEALKTRGKDLAQYFQEQGIIFPDGAKVELHASKHTLTAKLPHQEALNVLQLIYSCIGEEGEESAKIIFGLSQTHQGDCRCFGPSVDEAKANRAGKK